VKKTDHSSVLKPKDLSEEEKPAIADAAGFSLLLYSQWMD
jgi:hypothetical protein